VSLSKVSPPPIGESHVWLSTVVLRSRIGYWLLGIPYPKPQTDPFLGFVRVGPQVRDLRLAYLFSKWLRNSTATQPTHLRHRRHRHHSHIGQWSATLAGFLFAGQIANSLDLDIVWNGRELELAYGVFAYMKYLRGGGVGRRTVGKPLAWSMVWYMVYHEVLSTR